MTEEQIFVDAWGADYTTDEGEEFYTKGKVGIILLEYKQTVVKNISSNPVLADSLPLSEVAELLRWYKQLSPAQKCSVHPPAGSGGSHGIYNQTEEELIEKWRKR